MTPTDLSARSFDGYHPQARQFAVEQLSLLQRLPFLVCPSFLQQIQGLDTLFPAERASLQRQCEGLAGLPQQRFRELTEPLAALSSSPALQGLDWVRFPARFVTEMTAYLWSSSQLNAFRKATTDLFAAVPLFEDTSHRLAILVLGQGATVDRSKVLGRLRRLGVTLSAVDSASAAKDIGSLLSAHLQTSPAPYSAWYVDGGAPHPVFASAFGDHGIAMSYPGLAPIRQRVLDRVQTTIAGGGSGPEQMRTRLMETSATEAGAREVTRDPILQRFYTELFTESSGPQIFSTSVVQWAGRELARRAQPQTLLLRYAARQRHQDMNTMFAETAPTLDPQGSLRDAEMGAYYSWIEMNRISSPGKLTLLAWVENQPVAVILGPGAPAGTTCTTPLTLRQAVANFG